MKTKEQNRHGNLRPLFCTIAADGGIYAVKYHFQPQPDGGLHSSINREGYGPDVFDQVPKGTPLVDYRTADIGKLIKLLFAVEIYEHTGPRMFSQTIPAAEFIQRAKEIGATVTTL